MAKPHLSFILLLAACSLYSCDKSRVEREAGDTDRQPVTLVSWGGKFQEDLLNYWIQPAAKACHIKLQTEAWDGNYSNLASKIEKRINNWDIVHVEAHFVENPNAQTLFTSFPLRRLKNVDSTLQNERAVPILEYGYVLAYRSDLLNTADKLDWADFWDLQRYPGMRGIRDFPVGNIEIALTSMGRNVNDILYSGNLRRADIEQQVTDALNRLGELRGHVVWWTTGDQLQKGLTTGDTPIAAAWSGRAWSSHKELCGMALPENCKIKANPETSFVSTDWWIIPKGSGQSEKANQLLTCMFNQPTVISGAERFVLSQGYAVPVSTLAVEDPSAQFYLKLGSSSNFAKAGRIDEKFWGQNYDWIASRWRRWRAE